MKSQLKEVKVANIGMSNKLPFSLIAGLNVLEEKEIINEVVEVCKQVTQDLGIPFIFKASYDKANRSSINSRRHLRSIAGNLGAICSP